MEEKKLRRFKLKVALHIVNVNLTKTTTISKATEDASERLDKAEEAFEFARDKMHRQNQLTYTIRKQLEDSAIIIRMLKKDEFHLANENRAYLTQQLVDVKAKIKEQEVFKQEAENLLEIDTNFQEACAAFKKAELDMHNARDAHEVAAIDEMKAIQKAIQKRERLRKLLAYLTQELSTSLI
jgi:hypothetical protein